MEISPAIKPYYQKNKLMPILTIIAAHNELSGEQQSHTMTYIKQFRSLLLFFVFLTIQSECMAWGAVGHKLVAKIGYSLLNVAEKDSLTKYLRGTSIEDASVWMDEIKADKSYDFQKPWHYINIDKDSVYNPTDTANIIWALNRVVAELKERQKYSKEKVETDLKILMHLMGDLHQPLHVGYASDIGGNSVQVFYAASPTNLHHVWDTEIIHDGVLGQPLDWSKLSQFSSEELAHIRHIDFVAWMNESRSKLDTVYDFKGNDLNHKYVAKNAPLVERQLLLGGIRLAAVLKYIFQN
jgi:hypothetical protein